MLKRCTQVFDENGHFAPAYDDENTTTLEGNSILMAVGQKTDLSFLGEELELKVNRGLISVEPDTLKMGQPGPRPWWTPSRTERKRPCSWTAL